MRMLRVLLTLAAGTLFAGRAYEYLFFGAPLRVLLWDQELLQPLVRAVLGMDWTTYVTDPGVDRWIDRAQRLIGVVFALAAAGAVLRDHLPRRLWSGMLFAATGFLALHALLDTKDHFFYLAQYVEYAIQLSVGPLLWWSVTRARSVAWLLTAVAVVTALTFVAHGLYALGAYPVPVKFLNMTLGITGWSEAGCRLFLQVVGWLDLVAAALLFVPRLRRFAFFYCTVWGALTALARLVYGLGMTDFPDALHQYGYLTVYRLPHALIPAVGWWLSGVLNGERKLPG